jgi:tripartite-type tricarboxylate transporter receptor subunit TctC
MPYGPQSLAPVSGVVTAPNVLLVHTPKPVIASSNDQMRSWLDDPKIKERFTQMAGFPAYGTPAAFDTSVKGQIAPWKGVIHEAGLQLDVN